MTTEEIIEGNKLIAEFMGGRKVTMPLTNREAYKKLPAGFTILSENLKYHSSWDWLMPVVERIEESSFAVLIDVGNSCEIWKPNCEPNVSFEQAADNTIEATWLAVVDFIKWYNQNKI